MSATNEHLIHFFHKNFSNIDKTDTFTLKQFVRNLINFSKEIHLQNANDEEQLSQLPLLAIFSRLLWDYAEQLSEIAKDEPILHAALNILSNYPVEKRHVLEKHFL